MDEEIHDRPMCILQTRHVASKQILTVTLKVTPLPAALFCNCRFPVFIRTKNMQTKKISIFACCGAFSESTVVIKRVLTVFCSIFARL